MGVDGEGSKQVRLVSSSLIAGVVSWAHEGGQWRMEGDEEMLLTSARISETVYNKDMKVE